VFIILKDYVYDLDKHKNPNKDPASLFCLGSSKISDRYRVAI